MNDMASIRNIRCWLSDMPFGPLDATVAIAGSACGTGSVFFADVFPRDNLFSLAVGTGVEGELVEAERQISVNHFGLGFASGIVENEIELAIVVVTGWQCPVNLLIMCVLG